MLRRKYKRLKMLNSADMRDGVQFMGNDGEQCASTFVSESKLPTSAQEKLGTRIKHNKYDITKEKKARKYLIRMGKGIP